MSLQPLWAEGAATATHALLALAALALGALQLALPKGGARHRAMGWGWIGIMVATALSALFVGGLRGIADPNWLHLLIVLTFWGIFGGIRAIRAGNRPDHARTMTMVFAGALVLAGAFTLTPGRVMRDVIGLAP